MKRNRSLMFLQIKKGQYVRIRVENTQELNEMMDKM